MWAMCGCWHCEAWELELCERYKTAVVAACTRDDSQLAALAAALYHHQLHGRHFLHSTRTSWIVLSLFFESVGQWRHIRNLWLVNNRLQVDHRFKKSSFTTLLLICILFMTHWSTDIQLPEIWKFIPEFIVLGPSRFRIPKFSGPVNITSWLWWVW